MAMQVKNWSKFQHFKDRKPLWIKLYRNLLDDDEWFDLDAKSCRALIMLWLIASEDSGRLPNIKKLAFRMRMPEQSIKQILSELSHWIETVETDIKLISGGYQVDALEKETEKETQVRDIKQTVAPNGASFGCQDWPSNHEQLFWIKYPHKVGKRAAMKALTSVRRRSKIPWAEFMAALDAYIANKPAERHWCNPATWLNQDRFEDRPGPPPVVIQTPKERMSDVLQQLGSGNFGQDLDIGLPQLVSK